MPKLPADLLAHPGRRLGALLQLPAAHARWMWPAAALAAIALAGPGCGSLTEPGRLPVGSVTVSSTDGTSLSPGASLQLTVAVRDSAGGILTDRPVTWSSLDTARALVDQTGLVTARAHGVAVIVARCEGVSGQLGLTIVAIPVGSIGITVEGDTLLYPGQTTLLVAMVKDSLGRPLADRTVQWSSSDPATAAVDQAGWVRAVKPGTVNVAAVTEGKAAVVSLRVRPVPVASVTITISGDTVLYERAYRALSAVTRDSAGGLLTGRVITWWSSDTAVATVSQGFVQGVWEGRVIIRASSEGHADSIALRVLPVPVAMITVDQRGLDALYGLGGTFALTATLWDATGTVLDPTRRSVVWSSSNTAVATVDSVGTVTGLAPGPVTITVTREGKEGTAALVVLPPPIADWTAAADWVTHQANAERTGHIAATADPRAFADRWTATIVAGARLSPAVASDGRVFVATDTYYGAQLLAAYDAATGQQLWVENFGQIHGVHDPAVGNGRVYVTTSGHENSFLYAFDAATGTRAFRTRYGNQWSRYYAPVVTANAVYFAGGYYGGLYRYDAITGDTVWFLSTNQYDGWTPSLRDGVVYAYTGSYAPKLEAVHADSGSVLYSIPDSSFVWNGWSMSTAPVLGGADNVLAVQAGRLLIFDLAARTVRWERNDEYLGMVSVDDGLLYVANGDALEARAEADGGFRWAWTAPTDVGTLRGTLALTDNLVFVGTDSVTFAVDRQAGAAVWRYPAGGRLSIDGQGTLYIAQANGVLRAVGLR